MINDFMDCKKCKYPGSCCSTGVEVDLKEAKKIVKLGLYGQFHHLEEDDQFPSGFKVSTSYRSEVCTFICVDGMCAIHKINYGLKPKYCKEFPYCDEEFDNGAVQKCVQLKIKEKR